MAIKRIGAREANQHFAALLRDIEESGDVVVITRRGQPIVEMHPARRTHPRDAKAVARSMQSLFEKYSRPMGGAGVDRKTVYTRGLLDPNRPLE